MVIEYYFFCYLDYTIRLERFVIFVKIRNFVVGGSFFDFSSYFKWKIPKIYFLGKISVDDKHLDSWAGLSPRCNESARKEKAVKITKAGVYIKPLLVQCALCAIKDKSCPYIKARYKSLKRRRGHKKAIIAIARLLLTSIYHILNTGEVFDYDRFDKLLNRNFKTQQKVKNTPEEMISYLTSLGYEVTMQNT